MQDHEDLTQRLLGDISPDPLDLTSAPASRRFELLEKLKEPVSLGWLLVILAAFLGLVLIIS